MQKDELSRPETVETKMEELVWELDLRQQTGQSLVSQPEIRLLLDIRQAYQAEADEDQRSLERVLSRLVAKNAVRSEIISFPRTEQHRERTPSMQDIQNTMNSVPHKKTQSRWVRRVGLLAAVICLALLVGSFLVVLRAGHTTGPAGTNIASARGTTMPTFVPTPALKSGPVGTIVRQGIVYTSPLAWSPLGNRVAGVSEDNRTAETWDGVTGTNVLTYHLPFTSSDAIIGAAWSVDGTRVAFVTPAGVAVFNARTTVLSGSLPLPQASTTQPVQSQGFQGVSWSPDGRYVVTSYVLVTGQTIPKYNNPHPAGTQIVSQLYIWDQVTRQVVTKTTGDIITQILWSPDGRYLATWANNDSLASHSVLSLWNTATWQVIRTVASVNDFAWSPTGAQMALARDGGVQIIDTASGHVLRSFAGSAGSVISALAWQPHGTRLLVNTHNVSANTSSVSLWDTQTGAQLYAFTTYQGAFTSNQAWSSDGKYVLMSAFGKTLVGQSSPDHVGWYEVIWIAD